MQYQCDGSLLNTDFPFIYLHKKDTPSPSDIIPSHLHDCLEINRIISGSAQIFTGGKVITVFKGDILLFGSHQLHSWSVSPAGTEWKVFMFDKNLVCPDTASIVDYNYLLPFIALSAAEEGKLNADWDITKETTRLLESIDKHYEKQKDGWELEIKAYLLLFLSRLYSHFVRKKETDLSFIKNNFSRLYPVQKYIKEHLNESLTLEDAAEMAGMQRNYFSHFFKKTTGINFSEYIIRLRLFHAIHLIENTNRTISDILFECGFNNESYFYRIFKKMIGKSPAFFRDVKP